MAQQQQQGQGGGNESLDFLWIVAVLVIGVVAVWYFYSAQITSFVFWIRLYEIKLINWVVEPLKTFFEFLNLPFPSTDALNAWERYIKTRPAKVPFSLVAQVSYVVGAYLRFLTLLVLGLLGLYIFRKHIGLKFKSIFSMLTLKKAEQEVWPQSRPTLALNLLKDDISKGPWAMALTTLAFCEKHQIIESQEIEGHWVGKLIEGPAYRVFSLQTGRLWMGPKHLKLHVKALFTIFAAKANHDSEVANKLLDQISASAGSSKLNFSGVQPLFDKYYNTEPVQHIIARHAYLLTIMASMLEQARTDGVLASAEFLWLKPLDRPLWYMLNSVGRRVAVPEISGAFAHWIAEKELGGAIRTPMVDSAIKGMRIELENTLYLPDKVKSKEK
jgi:intracellular multiplication protein IcmP